MNKKLTSLIVVVFVLVLGAMVVPTLAAPYDGTIVSPDAVAYHTDGRLDILVPDADGNWDTAISLTDAELDAVSVAPEINTLVASSGDLALYKLTSGEWQINAGPDAEGKLHVLVYDAGFGSTHAFTTTP